MMYWPWHFDQAGHDAAEERAERQLEEREEAELMTMLETVAAEIARSTLTPETGS